MLLSLLLLHEDLLFHVLGVAGQTVGVEVVVALGLCESFFLLSREKGIFEGFLSKELCNHPAELGFHFHVSGIHGDLVLAEPPIIICWAAAPLPQQLLGCCFLFQMSETLLMSIRKDFMTDFSACVPV